MMIILVGSSFIHKPKQIDESRHSYKLFSFSVYLRLDPLEKDHHNPLLTGFYSILVMRHLTALLSFFSSAHNIDFFAHRTLSWHFRLWASLRLSSTHQTAPPTSWWRWVGVAWGGVVGHSLSTRPTDWCSRPKRSPLFRRHSATHSLERAVLSFRSLNQTSVISRPHSCWIKACFFSRGEDGNWEDARVCPKAICWEWSELQTELHVT